MSLSEPPADLTAEVSGVVAEADTARAWGEVFPAVASTPFVLGLAEVACHRSVEGVLEPGELTVGVSATIEHLAASPLGTRLTATAGLRQRDGRRLRFDAEVADARRVVARVTHERAIVSAERIAASLESDE
jgi:fluoroacetyl-CoA thioesterase